MRKFTVLVVLVVLLVISGIFGIRAIMAGTSSAILNSAASFLFGIQDMVQFRGIISENETLRSEMFDLRAKLIETEEIRTENDLLRTQLNAGARRNYDLEAVKFFNVSYEEITATAFIDKGSDHGIEVGMPVITGRSTLVGVVREVFDKYSKLILVTDKRFKMTVLDENLNQFLAIGDGGHGVQLDFVAPRDDFKENELIVSEVSEKVPSFLIIGEVDSVSHTETDLFKKVRVRPAFLNLDLRTGFVIRDF
jgi:rod shape-determining protein MreC